MVQLLRRVRSNFNTRELNTPELSLFLSTLLEAVFSVFYHIWTQDNPNVPLLFGGKTGTYIDQGGSHLKV